MSATEPTSLADDDAAALRRKERKLREEDDCPDEACAAAYVDFWDGAPNEATDDEVWHAAFRAGSAAGFARALETIETYTEMLYGRGDALEEKRQPIHRVVHRVRSAEAARRRDTGGTT